MKILIVAAISAFSLITGVHSQTFFVMPMDVDSAENWQPLDIHNIASQQEYDALVGFICNCNQCRIHASLAREEMSKSNLNLSFLMGRYGKNEYEDLVCEVEREEQAIRDRAYEIAKIELKRSHRAFYKYPPRV